MLMIGAALLFFTRLPMWRFIHVPSDRFKNIIYYWPVAGWLTAVVMAGVLYVAQWFLPFSVAVMLAIACRIVLTGGLHEDGLADFCDGFGGGRDRERILAIMKDSHIGSYGVLGLVLYALLLYSALSSLPVKMACLGIIAADPFCKALAACTTARLPYARTAQTSKTGVVYASLTPKMAGILLFFGCWPFLFVLPPVYYASIILPLILFWLLTQWMKHKIKGYTGDCLGALFLLLEFGFYLNFLILWRLL